MKVTVEAVGAKIRKPVLVPSLQEEIIPAVVVAVGVPIVVTFVEKWGIIAALARVIDKPQAGRIFKATGVVEGEIFVETEAKITVEAETSSGILVAILDKAPRKAKVKL